MTSLQLTFNFKKHIWSSPLEYRDLSDAEEIAIDLETRDDGISKGLGAGWALGRGEIIGFAVATEGFQAYYPFGHFGGGTKGIVGTRSGSGCGQLLGPSNQAGA